MTEVIGVRFKESNKTYNYASNGYTVKPGDIVIVDSQDVIKDCTVAKANFFVDDDAVIKPLKPIIRVATEADLETIEENEALSKKAFEICKTLIAKHELEMTLSNATYSFNRALVFFYYTAPSRVDFRALVKDLAHELHTRVELRQVGQRDECQMFGGIGICGRQFCCNSFLKDFQSVLIKSAKKQRLPINSQKMSGPCERLRCCLRFEEEAYDDLIKCTPAIGSKVKTPAGIGTVIDSNLISGDLKISFDNGEECEIAHFNRDEVTPAEFRQK